VSSNNDGLSPAWDESWDVADDDGLTENGTVENVSNSSVRRLPHLLKVELLDTTLIRCNGGALNADFVLLHSLRAVNSNLIICCVTILN
jgi:hypothetical protein